jgi:hypothetical protein
VLRVTGDGGDVMKTGDFLVHGAHTEFTSILTRESFRS